MNRDTMLFAGFILLFSLVNIVLLSAGAIAPDWTGFGVIVAAGFSLALYSFLYKDNPLFKFAEHVYVGVAAAYTFGQVWFPTLLVEIIAPIFAMEEIASPETTWWIAVPTILGILMLTRFSSRFGWLSRIAFAFVVGLGAGFAIPRTVSALILAQVEPTLAPLTTDWAGLNLLIILVGVVTVLVYFFFSVEHTGVVGRASKLGIWFLMMSFGASFGYTIMGRLSLLIGRVNFLFRDWLHLTQ